MLYRLRPEAARTNSRTAHHRQPRNGAKTKWAASTKYTCLRPRRACFRRGPSFSRPKIACSGACSGIVFLGGTGMAPVLRQRSPSWSLRKCRTWVRPLGMPVCCSMIARACLAERGGCFRKYSSREDSCSAKALWGVMPPAATQMRQTTFKVLVQVTLDGATGDIGVGSDLVVGQALALEPEDLHLALDAGIGVMVPVVGQGL